MYLSTLAKEYSYSRLRASRPYRVPPPKKKQSMVGSLFLHRCLVSQKFFPKEKVDFVGDIKR